MKKIFAGLILIVLLMGVVSASLIATIGMTGLNFVNPTAATVVKGVLCVTSPIGVISCVEQYIEGKVIGFISGEVLQAIAELSPEAAKAIITYNQVQGYIDKGATILEELEINEEGEAERGILEFDENEYSLAFESFFGNLTVEDIIVSKSEYNSETKELTIKEGGFLKIRIKDEEGEERELIYKNIKTGGKFILNDNGLIEEADFVVSGDNSVYKFGNNDAIKVNTDAHILYKDGKVKVSGKDMNFLYGDLNITLNKNFVDFFGNKVFCVDCKIDEVELKALPGTLGSLTISDKGYLINSGEVIYKQNKFSVREDKNAVLIANRDTNILGYNGNWLRQTSKTLEVQSGEEGYIKVDFLENHEILNTDDRDKGYVEIIEGDGLKFINRNEEGLIPRVIHKSSEEGHTSLVNDKLEFEFEKDMFVMDSPKPLTLEEIQNEKYQSIAMEIDGKLRINSYRQFCLLSENNEELVTFNKYGLPCSAQLEDNELQTIEQLREKYPEIKFTIEDIDYDGDEIPAYLAWLTNIFLELNPDVKDNIDSFSFDYSSNANGYSHQFFIGLDSVDPSSEGFSRFREIDRPLQVLNHEYTHIHSYSKEEDEINYGMSSIPDLQINELRERINGIQKAMDDELAVSAFYEEFGIEYEQDLVSYNIMVEQIKMMELYKQELSFLYNSRYSDRPTLQYRYNTLAEQQLLGMLSNPEFIEQLNEILDSTGYGNNKLSDFDQQFLTSVDKFDYKTGSIMEDIRSTYNQIDRNPELKNYRLLIDGLVREFSGLPYLYSSKTNEQGVFGELLPTYHELPIEERRRMVNSGNLNIRNTFRILTQSSFDSGRMKVKDYKYIMGENFCERADCLDKLCVEYDLLCCIEHPNSPNC